MSNIGGAAFRHSPEGNHHNGDREGNVDKERPTPGSMCDEPPAKDRTERGGNCRKSGPSADSAAARFLVQARADDGEATGNEQCRSAALNTPCDYESTD